MDYRKVNAIIRKDAYHFPRVDDTSDALVGSQWFTTLELISGYRQVEMDLSNRQLFVQQRASLSFK